MKSFRACELVAFTPSLTLPRGRPPASGRGNQTYNVSHYFWKRDDARFPLPLAGGRPLGSVREGVNATSSQARKLFIDEAASLVGTSSPQFTSFVKGITMKFFASSARIALLTSALLAASSSTKAQQPQLAPAPAAAGSLAIVEADDVAILPQTLARRGAISLGASSADLDDNPRARAALVAWVANGGVVFLHTDAARIFGYQTVVAREGNPRVAGQLEGRARAALPWGAHPLLETDARGTRAGDAFDLPGVGTVFYSLRAGDHLVVSHPAGTPLLEVTDLVADTARPLYAAAIAPFGRGWAVFTPDSVDQRRADGAAFARNLLTLVPSTGATASPWVGIPQNALSGAALRNALDEALAGSSAPALPAFGTGAGMMDNGAAPIPGADVPVAVEVTPGVGTPATANPATANPATANPAGANVGGVPIPAAPRAATVPVILMRRAQATALRAALGTNEATVSAILTSRAALLRGDLATANASLGGAREGAETALVAGSVAAAAADDVTLASPSRAAAARDAAALFERAATVPARTAATTPTALGVSAAQLRGWSAEFARLSRIFALEPPLAQTVGAGVGAITVRFYENDGATPLVLPGAALLANTRVFGWRTDREEVLLFPTPELYLNYRRAAGLNQQNVPLADGVAGDVFGQRVLMLAVPANPQLARGPNGQLRVLGARTTSLTLLARLHAYALLGAWVGENPRIPTWFTLGLETVADGVLNGEVSAGPFGQTLQNTAQLGGLLSPAQFESNAQSDIALAQSAALVSYFYRVSGPGRVAEVVARWGSGQNPDAAFEDVTGADQITFFRAWRDAQFGAQRFN